MEQNSKSAIQAKIFDFALTEIIRSQRDCFKPLWTIDSWAKFLIWMTLNCGLSGEKESLELFAQALGPALTQRMRKIFFERVYEDLSLHLMADPADEHILVMPLNGLDLPSKIQITQALDMAGLSEKVVPSSSLWKERDSIIAIPWNPLERDI